MIYYRYGHLSFSHVGVIVMIEPMTMYDNIGQWMHYCVKVFKYFNGRVNYILPATDITFGNPHKYRKNFIFATNKIDQIEINLLDIIHYCVKINIKNEEEIKGIIVFTILHELSHCDQDINFRFTMHDAKETLKYEVANDLNSLAFLYSEMQEVDTQLGPIRLTYVERLLHDARLVKPSDTIYYRIATQADKIIRILEYLMNTPLRECVYGGQFAHLGLEYLPVNGGRQSQIFMHNSQWLPFFTSFKLLRKVMGNNDTIDVGFQEIAQSKSLFVRVTQISKERIHPLYIDKRKQKSKR